ncbi:MAG TPA: serine hydrolase domain-containing protein [Candidatus Acidoferrum sp.]|jgi:CubicO group peptidase (beta-lactamase class C family)
MRIARNSAGAASAVAWCVAAALICFVDLSVHARGASLSDGPAVEAQMIPKIGAIFAPLSDARSPGVAVLVRRGGRTIFQHGYGVRDLRSLAAIDAETNFRLASCTKQFAAMAIMLLVHDRKLRYEQSLAEIFPEFPAYGSQITINNLLHHTSGLPDYETLMEQEEKSGGRKWTEENQIHDADVLALLEKEKLPLFPPGTKWAYSNSGYVVLGLVVAKVSGKTFGDFLHERIFAPLKMDQTIAYENRKNEVANRAFGHSRDGGAWKQTDQSSTSATLGDGGVYSSLRDLAKWDDALAKHTLLSDTEMRAALTPATLFGGAKPVWPAGQDRAAGTPVAYGFGWFLDPYRGHARMWHYGDTMGFHTYIERFGASASELGGADHNAMSIIVLCNRTDLDPEALAAKIADLYIASK